MEKFVYMAIQKVKLKYTEGLHRVNNFKCFSFNFDDFGVNI